MCPWGRSLSGSFAAFSRSCGLGTFHSQICHPKKNEKGNRIIKNTSPLLSWFWSGWNFLALALNAVWSNEENTELVNNSQNIKHSNIDNNYSSHGNIFWYVHSMTKALPLSQLLYIASFLTYHIKTTSGVGMMRGEWPSEYQEIRLQTKSKGSWIPLPVKTQNRVMVR